ncbi:sulfatase [Haloferula sp. BvORR071]|uniref:sulfatase family protein n=1 Tax=Haloferula sp. BvORR071 TaxID=1396141 RepID=UPI0009464A9E|nr:sulfatase [Haloferula sp. BvORR071]
MHPLLRSVFLLAGMALLPSLAAAEPSGRPNIVFIFADDHALQAISAYNFRGRSLNQTPNIDRIAKEGAIFRNNFCANSICSPSRATVLTGKHSHLNGVTTWEKFDGSQFTFAKALQAAGYRTGIFGKWHLTSEPTGFDEWMVHPGQGSYHNPDFITPQGNRRIPGYATDVTTDLSLDFIKRHKEEGQPFLVMCQYKAPHRTWQPPTGEAGRRALGSFAEPPNLFDTYEGRSKPVARHLMGIDRHMKLDYDLKVPVEKSNEWARMTEIQHEAYHHFYDDENRAFLEANLTGKDLVRWKYQRYLRDYLSCVDSIDSNVGRILACLKESGLDRNTLVVYSSDQGFYLGEHGWFDKRWMYEESFRMPLLIRWPGHIEAGTEVGQLTQNIDFAPTFLAAAGLPVPPEVQGLSLMPLLTKQPVAWRDALYYHYYDGPGEHGVAKHYGVRTDRYKLIRFYADDAWELYDLEKDPEEMHSVYDDPAYTTVRAELTAKLDELKKQYANPILTVADEKKLSAKP